MDERPAPSAALSSGRTAGEAGAITDYYRWALEQAALIRARRFDEIDLVNVAEEIEDVGKSEFRSLRSNLESILVHLLKWQYQPERRSRSWELSIDEHRRRVVEGLHDSASMAVRWDEAVSNAYAIARPRAAREAGLVLRHLPAECPYDRHEIMEADYSLRDV